MSLLQQIFFVGVFLSSFRIVLAESPLVVNIDRIYVKTDPTYLSINSRLRADKDGFNVVDASIDLHHKVEGKVFIENEVWVTNKAHNLRVLKNEPINICTFLADPSSNQFLSLIYNAMTKFGVRVSSCSYPINEVKFSLKGFHLDNTAMPLDVPEGEYRIEVKISRQSTAGEQLKMLMNLDVDVRVQY